MNKKKIINRKLKSVHWKGETKNPSVLLQKYTKPLCSVTNETQKSCVILPRYTKPLCSVTNDTQKSCVMLPRIHKNPVLCFQGYAITLCYVTKKYTNFLCFVTMDK